MSRSIFPGGVDQFQELFDLPYNKMQDANRLTELKMQASLTNDEQNEVIRLSAELKDYIITPESLNKFQDALTAVEQFFYDEVDGYIEGKQELWAGFVDNFKHIGTWEEGAEYKFQNMVISPTDGNLYLCKRDHTSTTTNKPLKGSQIFWIMISSKGDKGDPGLSGVLKGEWNSTTNYVMGDAVMYRKLDSDPTITYIALKANVGKDPSTSPLDWMLLDKLSSGTTLPSTQANGAHFIQYI